MNAKKLGVAGLVLKVISMLSPNNVPAQEIEKVNIESEYARPQVIATFEYKSNRPEPEYNGKTFTYNLWSNGLISQENPEVQGVEFSQRWFYDINSDGNFDRAELDAMKNKTLIYMHPEFNDIVNNLIAEKLESGEHSQKVIDNYRKLCAELYGKISKRESERKSKKNLWSVIFGAKAGSGWGNKNDSNAGFVGTELGIRYKNLAGLLNFNYGFPETLEQVKTEPSEITGRYFEGTKKNSESFSAGLSGEYHFPISNKSSLFFGAGPNVWNYTTETSEKIKQGSQTIVSNSDSEAQTNISGNFYTGIQGKRFGASLGYDTRRGFYAGGRINYPSNKYKRK